MRGPLLRFAYIKTAVVLPTRVGFFFSFLIFFPVFALLRKKGEGGGEVIERLGGYLAFSQGQTTRVFFGAQRGAGQRQFILIVL